MVAEWCKWLNAYVILRDIVWQKVGSASKEKTASLKSSTSGVTLSSSVADDVITIATVNAALSTTTTAAADTSTETAKKLKEVFRTDVSTISSYALVLSRI